MSDEQYPVTTAAQDGWSAYDSPSAIALLVARVLVVIVLGVAWICALGELVMSELALCIAPDASAGCGESNPALTQRNALWTGPVFAGGPVIAMAAWLALTPRGHRYWPAWVLLSVIWVCASPTLFLDAHLGAAACGSERDTYCGPGAESASALKEVMASVGLVGGPAATAALAYHKDRRTTGRVFGIITIVAMALVLVKNITAIAS